VSDIGDLRRQGHRRRSEAADAAAEWILFFDRSGFCLLYKRLEKGTFQLPAVGPDGSPRRELTPNELGLILEGVDLRQRARRARLGRPQG
jgi:transposase